VLQVATARCTWPTLLVPALGPVRHGTGGHRLAHIARTLIATAEKIYRDHADLPGFDFGAVTVQLDEGGRGHGPRHRPAAAGSRRRRLPGEGEWLSKELPGILARFARARGQQAHAEAGSRE